jgi:hypothetical protein
VRERKGLDGHRVGAPRGHRLGETKLLVQRRGAASVYTVGKSLVTHLIDELGEAGFLETLAVWASSPDVLIAQYEPEWRESLGLPRECVAASDGSG